MSGSFIAWDRRLPGRCWRHADASCSAGAAKARSFYEILARDDSKSEPAGSSWQEIFIKVPIEPHDRFGLGFLTPRRKDAKKSKNSNLELRNSRKNKTHGGLAGLRS
jgi:hypothetical protein